MRPIAGDAFAHGAQKGFERPCSNTGFRVRSNIRSINDPERRVYSIPARVTMVPRRACGKRHNVLPLQELLREQSDSAEKLSGAGRSIGAIGRRQDKSKKPASPNNPTAKIAIAMRLIIACPLLLTNAAAPASAPLDPDLPIHR